MAIERTLSIIKPDAVAKNVIGQIYARFEAAGLKVVAAKMVHLSRGEAEAFYAVHKARPFFSDLVSFMPRLTYAKEEAQGLIAAAELNDPVCAKATIDLITARGHKLSAAARSFMRHLLAV